MHIVKDRALCEQRRSFRNKPVRLRKCQEGATAAKPAHHFGCLWRDGLRSLRLAGSRASNPPHSPPSRRRQSRDDRSKKGVWLDHAAILRQLSAQARHACTHSCMSPTSSQLLAHSSQISAHSLQRCLACSEFISMK